MKAILKDHVKGDEVIERDHSLNFHVYDDTFQGLSIIIKEDYIEITGLREAISVYPLASNHIQIKAERR